MKLHLSILCMIIACYIHIASAQDASVMNYLQQAGIYAEIYNGRMEMIYAPSSHENLPYYKNDNFTEASIIYRKNYYPNQKARLDLFQEQLIILSPEKQHGIILDAQQVEKVQMHNKTIVYLTPPKDSKLNDGYYVQLLEGEKIHLFCKENYSLKQQIQGRAVVNYFDHSIRYYLLHNDRYYLVKNKNSFSKLFPQYKKQINSFVKDKRLNFKQSKDESLTSLTRYCEELITPKNKQ